MQDSSADGPPVMGGGPAAGLADGQVMTVLDASAAVSAGAALENLSDDELFRLYRDGPEGGRQREAACEELVRRYTPLVRACVRPFRNSPSQLTT